MGEEFENYNLFFMPWYFDCVYKTFLKQGLKFDVSSCSFSRRAHANEVLRAHRLTHMEKSRSI